MLNIIQKQSFTLHDWLKWFLIRAENLYKFCSCKTPQILVLIVVLENEELEECWDPGWWSVWDLGLEHQILGCSRELVVVLTKDSAGHQN